jgi:hypothetical protein
MSSDATDVGGAIARPSMAAALYAGEYPAPVGTTIIGLVGGRSLAMN